MGLGKHLEELQTGEGKKPKGVHMDTWKHLNCLLAL